MHVGKARKVDGGDLVALKTIRSATDEGVKRFLIEVHAASKLRHDNILLVHGTGVIEGVPFYTMRLATGSSLAERLERFNDPKAAAALVRAVALGVQHAHEHGVVHRDLKPSNILFDERGTPQVSDFGLAKSSQGESGSTLSGTIMGTPDYMAPEQARGESKDAKEQADVWSLGVILYLLLTKKLPFQGPSREAVLRKIIHSKPPYPEPTVDLELAAVCLKCLKKEPAKRYQSAKALLEDLDRWLIGNKVQAQLPDDHPNVRARVLENLHLPANPLVLPKERPIRVIIIDDLPMVRSGIRVELEKLPTVQVVGEAGDGREAIALVREHRPDVVLMDISMRGLNGLEATSRITKQFPGIHVIILSVHQNEEYFWTALKAGASGYLLKKAATAELASALRRVAGGEIYLAREISNRLVRKFPLHQLAHQRSPLEKLTDRQREILQLTAEGQTTKAIGLILKLSPKTVEYHRTKLMETLKIYEVPGLVRFALQSGLISQD